MLISYPELKDLIVLVLSKIENLTIFLLLSSAQNSCVSVPGELWLGRLSVVRQVCLHFLIIRGLNKAKKTLKQIIWRHPMELEFKKDFEQAKQNWSKFWEGKMHRPILRLTAPKENAAVTPWPNCYAHGQKSRSIEEWLDQVEAYVSSHVFIAEAIPAYLVSFAPDHFSALLGADIRLHPDSDRTAWVDPFVDNWNDAEIKFRKDGFWWERTVAFMRAFRKRFDGRVLLSPPNIQGGLDCLAAIRGVNELLLDILDCPEKISLALQSVNTAVDQVRAAFAAELDIPAYGFVNRHMFYSSQLIDVPQCDFSCMISPEMFREFQMPALEHELAELGSCDYHLDGPGAIKHLEAICELDKVQVIQWQPGAGEAADQDWWQLYQKIDSLGRGHYIFKDIKLGKRIWNELSSRKVFIDCCCQSRREAMQILEEFEKTSAA
jgi:5-methyltetrahydrofolate--homocysteine methyltransferase